jgi:Tfp pilus assembly protein PilN
MRAVNLLPQDETRVPVEGARPALLIGAGGLVAVTVLAAVLAVSATRSAADREEKTTAVEAQIAKVPKAPKPPVSQGVLAQERADRVNALAAALSSRVAFDRILLDVSRVLPDDVWLTAMSAATPSEGGSGTTAASEEAKRISIQGATFSHASVARVLSRLAVVSSLDNVALETSAVVEPAAAGPGDSPKLGKRVVTFTVAATVRSRP